MTSPGALDDYLELIETERRSRPSEAKLADEIHRLRREFERVRDDLGHQKHMRAAVSEEMDRWIRKAMRLEEEVERLRSALERTQANLMHSIRGHPVRDLAENLAENETVGIPVRQTANVAAGSADGGNA